MGRGREGKAKGAGRRLPLTPHARAPARSGRLLPALSSLSRPPPRSLARSRCPRGLTMREGLGAACRAPAGAPACGGEAVAAAGGWAPSLALRAPACCSLSPSRLLLHLLLTARGGRQGAGAPGPARTPRPRPERLATPPYWLGLRTRGRSRDEETQGLAKRREEGTPRRTGRPPAPRSPPPLSPSPARPGTFARVGRAAARGAGLCRAARRPSPLGLCVTWWQSGFPSPEGTRRWKGVFSAPLKVQAS